MSNASDNLPRQYVLTGTKACYDDFEVQATRSVFGGTPTLYIDTDITMSHDPEHGPDCLIYINGFQIHGSHLRKVSRRIEKPLDYVPPVADSSEDDI